MIYGSRPEKVVWFSQVKGQNAVTGMKTVILVVSGMVHLEIDPHKSREKIDLNLLMLL